MGLRKDGHTQHVLIEKRKAVFLQTLAETGSLTMAAEAATPWSKNERGGLTTFKDARKRDPEFAAAWERAEQAALAKVENEIMRRAMTPESRPVFSKGELVGQHETYDNRLLLRVAARLNPEWREKQEIEHSGTVAHAHVHGAIVFAPKDILLLDNADERRLLVMLANKLADLKEAEEAKPNVIEHDPS